MAQVEQLLKDVGTEISPDQLLEPDNDRTHDELSDYQSGQIREMQEVNQKNPGVFNPQELDDDKTVYYGSNVKDSVYGVLEELEDIGYDTERVSSKKIKSMDADDFNGPLLLRSKRGFNDERTKRKLDILQKQGVDILPSPRGADAANDKLASKQVLNKSLNRVPKASTTDTYSSPDSLMRARFLREDIVQKPRKGSHGNGFEIISPEDELELNPDCIYEKKIDHWSDPNIDERRALMYVGQNEEKVIDIKTRKAKTNKEIPKNFNNGGSYSEPDLVLQNELEGALASGRAVDGGVIAVDYTLNKRTGEFEAIEINSTVQTHGIKEYSEIDIDQKTAEYIDNDLKGYSTRSPASEHLMQKIGLPEIAREKYDKLIER